MVFHDNVSLLEAGKADLMTLRMSARWGNRLDRNWTTCRLPSWHLAQVCLKMEELPVIYHMIYQWFTLKMVVFFVPGEDDDLNDLPD